MQAFALERLRDAFRAILGAFEATGELAVAGETQRHVGPR
jgi:hypothetical protein